MTIDSAIVSLAAYAVKENLIEPADRAWAINRIAEALNTDAPDTEAEIFDAALEELLKVILDYACENGLCENSVVYRDLFDTKIMGLLTPRPSQVIEKFYSEYEKSPEAATEYYYRFARKTDYIREYRIKNDLKWVTATEYGDIDITVNLSKPEKDPKAIAAALKMKQAKAYPKCMLCLENEGYAGRVNHPARQNHRIIPLMLDGDEWFLQYSPYVYYNEHCIVFDRNHTPMLISEDGFRKLFAFVKMFPHYFIGSNSDLPIAGGSILTHEHFQGGCYTFAMAKAQVETPVSFADYPDIEAGIVKWPMSVLRLKCENTDRICELAGKILNKWKGYTDEEAFIFAETDGESHNTVTPIARFRDGKYELDVVFRNNITTEQFPDGYYHPHPEYHHIKKENIGLIEVMGLAVLPSRLKTEMAILKDAMLAGADIAADERIAKHADWAKDIMARHNITADNCDKILEDEIGLVFSRILEQCGVFERTEKGKAQFLKFLAEI